MMIFTIVSEYFLTTTNVSSQSCKEIFPLISLMQSREINGKAIKVLYCICMFRRDHKHFFLYPSLLTVMNSQFTIILAVSPCVNSLVLCINLITAFHQPIPGDSCAVLEPHLVLQFRYSSFLY